MLITYRIRLKIKEEVRDKKEKEVSFVGIGIMSGEEHAHGSSYDLQNLVMI